MTVKGSVVEDPTAGRGPAEPFLRVADRATLHARRAQRFAALAATSPMADYLRFLGQVTAAQGAALAALPPSPPVEQAAMRRLLDHGMPLYGRTDWRRGPEWQAALDRMIEHLRGSSMPPAARAALDRLGLMPPPAREALADRVLGDLLASHELASALYVTATLQVYWLWLAGGVDPARMVPMRPNRLCPVCGSAPLVSLIDLPGLTERGRYLHCALCESDWRFGRATCAECGEAKGVAYHSLEEVQSPARAETCDECKTYVKILSGEKEPALDPVADDLATIGLDVKVSEAGWQRASANPFLLAG